MPLAIEPLDPSGRPHPKLVLALKRCIVDTFMAEQWTELGYITDLSDEIASVDRLHRSLYFGDDDYPDCVFRAVRLVLTELDASGVQQVIEFTKLEQWLAQHDPDLLRSLFSDDSPLVGLHASEAIETVPELGRQVARIRESIDTDPELAIGSAKEMLETVLKFVVDDPTSTDDIPALQKRARAKLRLEANPADKSEKATLGALSQIVVGVAEIRNRVGTGHGAMRAAAPLPAQARLVVDAAASVARFYLSIKTKNGPSDILEPSVDRS